MTVQVERLARVEVQVNDLRIKVDSLDSKIDDLLALRYKGVGAFWLASALLGTGIVGLLLNFVDWLRS